MLVLGAADTGKSTLVRNIRMIHNVDFTENELLEFKNRIRSDCLSALAHVLKMAEFENGIGYSSMDLKHDVKEFQSHTERGKYAVEPGWSSDPKLHELALQLWNEPIVQEIIASNSNSIEDDENKLFPKFKDFQADAYYLDHISAILSENFVPSSKDILSMRIPTTETTHTLVEIERMSITLIDVGGQRSERRKWLHCFESVNAVLFVAAISEYNLFVEEDPDAARMIESMKLFESICNIKWFSHASLMLFLNKTDIFKEKIKTVPLTVCFPEYKGVLDSYEQTSNYIWLRFQALCKTERTVYRHFTCAKDKNNIEVVFASVQDDVLRGTLREVGLS